jgi:hypothetical protein
LPTATPARQCNVSEETVRSGRNREHASYCLHRLKTTPDIEGRLAVFGLSGGQWRWSGWPPETLHPSDELVARLHEAARDEVSPVAAVDPRRAVVPWIK